MVHYHGWSAKWNEWLEKDSGRLRKRHSAQRAPAKRDRCGDGVVRHSETHPNHDDVCALCEEVGGAEGDELLYCDGQCRRAFHLTCVPSNNPPPPAEDDGAVPGRTRWRCADCRCSRMRCFLCKRWGSTPEEVVGCGRRACGKFYHPDCLAASLQQFGAQSGAPALAASLRRAA